MTPAKIISVIEMYEARLRKADIPKRPVCDQCTFKCLSEAEVLAHAHWLCDGVKQFAKDPTKRRKTGSHLTAVQMCLSFAGWYTLGELKTHNKPS